MNAFILRLIALTTDQIDIPKTPLVSGPDGTFRQALQLFFGLAGSVALLVMVIAGLKYTLSRGDANAIKNAKETILYAVVGLILCISGYGIVTFVVNNL